MPQSNPASRSATVRRAVPLVAVLAIGLLALSACGKRAPADPTGYFGQTPDHIAFVEWNQTKPTSTGTSSLSGTRTLATVDNQALSLQSDAVPLTGTLDNQTTVSIKLDRALDGSASWSGTLSGSRLTLSYTDGAGNVVTLPLLAASRSAYNVAVATEQQVLVDQKSGKVTSNASNAQEKAVDKWSKAVQADLPRRAADWAAVSGQVAAVTAANTSANAFKASAHHYLVDALKFKYGPQICPIANQSSASANSSSAQASAATPGKDRSAS